MALLAEWWTLHIQFQFLVLLCGQKLPDGKTLEMGMESVQRSISPLQASPVISKLGV